MKSKNIKLMQVKEKIKNYYYTEYPHADNELRQRAMELDIANLGLAEENRLLKEKDSNFVNPLLGELRAIVEEMDDPIGYLENEAKKSDGVLNGSMAVQISNDVEFYKSRARLILKKIREHFA